MEASQETNSHRSEGQRFITYASEVLGFLVNNHGFILITSDEHSKSVFFSNDSLNIETYWGKGEVDLLFRVLLENDVFRPHISKQFDLSEVVRQIDPNTFDEKPDLPEWALTANDAKCYLQYYAKLIQKYCLPILGGDLSVLESITKKRRNI
jgi:hypothetical protein